VAVGSSLDSRYSALSSFYFPLFTSLLQIDPHRLSLCVKIERLFTHLAPETALLIPAERRGRIDIPILVDPHRPGLDRMCEPVRLADIVPPHPGGEPVLRGIRPADQFVPVVKGRHSHHRPENLLAHDLERVIAVLEHRRRQEIAVRQFSAHALPTRS